MNKKRGKRDLRTIKDADDMRGVGNDAGSLLHASRVVEILLTLMRYFVMRYSA